MTLLYVCCCSCQTTIISIIWNRGDLEINHQAFLSFFKTFKLIFFSKPTFNYNFEFFFKLSLLSTLTELKLCVHVCVCVLTLFSDSSQHSSIVVVSFAQANTTHVFFSSRLWRTLCPQQSRRGWCSESQRTADIDLSCLPPLAVRQACGRQKVHQLNQHVCPPSTYWGQHLSGQL